MYSRYTPNASGGFDRRQLPDEADLRAAQGRAPPVEEMRNAEFIMQNERSGIKDQESGGGGTFHSTPLRSAQDEHVGAHYVRPQFPHGSGTHSFPPSPPSQHSLQPPPLFGGLLGPEGLLGQLLPHGLDTEDLLILAVLLLCMKQDGAAPLDLLVAVGIYLWL